MLGTMVPIPDALPIPPPRMWVAMSPAVKTPAHETK